MESHEVRPYGKTGVLAVAQNGQIDLLRATQIENLIQGGADGATEW